MGLFVTLLVGIVVGGGFGFLLMDNIDFLLLNVILGVAGSILGLGIYYFLLAGTHETSFVSLPSILCSVITAMVLLLIFNGIHKLMPKRTVHADHAEENPIDED